MPSSSSTTSRGTGPAQLVHERICQQFPEVLPYADFLVLDERLTVSVQPAVPIPRGYATYWPFRPDQRNVIDITLGVLLSDPDEFEILGYVALPRWLAGSRPLRIGATSSRTELFGRCDLDFLATVTVNPGATDGQRT